MICVLLAVFVGFCFGLAIVHALWQRSLLKDIERQMVTAPMEDGDAALLDVASGITVQSRR